MKPKKPYVDYEDDESELPLGGDRRHPNSKRNADYWKNYIIRKQNY